MSDTQHHWSSKHTLRRSQTHNWALILTAVSRSQAGSAWPTTAVGKNPEKQNGKRGTKSFPLARLCQLTQRGRAKELDEQHRVEDRGDLHHIKGNIYLKKTRSYRRFVPSSAESFTQGSLSKQFVMYRTTQMNSVVFSHLFLKQLHRIKMGFLIQH